MKNLASLALIASLYVIACALPAIGADRTNPIRGIWCNTSFPYVFSFVYWWANPLFFAGCAALACGWGRLASWLGLAASGLAVSYTVMSEFQGLLDGYFAWLASMLALTTAGSLWRHGGSRPVEDRRLSDEDPAHDASSPSTEEPSSASSPSAPLSSDSPS